MADQYNASFIHPTFIQSNYDGHFGVGVNFNPAQLTFNTDPDTVVRSFEHRIYSSNCDVKLTYNFTGVTSFGVVNIDIGFGNPTAFPSYKWCWTRISIDTSAETFQVYAYGTGGSVYTLLTPSPIPIVGNVISVESIGVTFLSANNPPSDESCQVTWNFRSDSYSLLYNYNAFGFLPEMSLGGGGWMHEIRGITSDYGQLIIEEDTLDAPPYLPVDSIVSQETFGLHTIIGTPIFDISPDSIVSQEAFGSPIVTFFVSYVYPNSIMSNEIFGNLILVRESTSKSALPPPDPASEGDIKVVIVPEGKYLDCVLSDRDVERDDGFETAVLVTLSTDKRADDGDPLPDDSGYRGGFWGDTIPVVADYKMGTKLWLLQRSKTIDEIPAITKEYLLDGFSWMIDDGIIDSVEISVERRRDLKTTIAFGLTFYRPEGNSIFYSFYYNWEAQLLRRG
jgi:phage gp46-like protein